MKRHLLAAVAFTAIASRCLGLVLSPGTLADYLALGPGGGTIGTTAFSNFSLLPNQAGATAIDPTSVLITPLDLLGLPTLQFAFNQTALAGELFELRLSYDVWDASIVGAGVGLASLTTTADAAITALLDVTGPLPKPSPLIAFETMGISSFDEQTAFASAGLITVESDVVIDGGLDGQSHLGVVTNRFVVPGTAVPVPDGGASAWLLASGVLGAGLLRRRLAR